MRCSRVWSNRTSHGWSPHTGYGNVDENNLVKESRYVKESRKVQAARNCQGPPELP